MVQGLATAFLLLYFFIYPFVLYAQTDSMFIAKFVFDFGDNLNFSQPEALSIDVKGNIYIVDSGNNRIVKVDKGGTFLDAVGGFGWQPEQFDRPLDVSVSSILDVFIADYNNQRIERYDKDLNYISSYTRKDNEVYELDFGFPSSVAMSKHGELFIADMENDRILKLDTFGQAVLVFGDYSWGKGKLTEPRKLEISDNDLIFVSDSEANDIVVYDYYGTYVNRFGSGFLKKPDGFTWWQNVLLVADSGNNRVVVFNRQRELIFAWGSKGKKYGSFNRPVDVGVFENKIYVLDSNNNRVQVFELIKK